MGSGNSGMQSLGWPLWRWYSERVVVPEVTRVGATQRGWRFSPVDEAQSTTMFSSTTCYSLREGHSDRLHFRCTRGLGDGGPPGVAWCCSQ